MLRREFIGNTAKVLVTSGVLISTPGLLAAKDRVALCSYGHISNIEPLTGVERIDWAQVEYVVSHWMGDDPNYRDCWWRSTLPKGTMIKMLQAVWGDVEIMPRNYWQNGRVYPFSVYNENGILADIDLKCHDAMNVGWKTGLSVHYLQYWNMVKGCERNI